MARSVYVPRTAVVTTYAEYPFNGDYAMEWDDYVEDLRQAARRIAPSMWWSGSPLRYDREGQIIAENYYALVVVSEYCGLVSISLVPKHDETLAQYWCERVANKFSALGNLVKVARFSNGECIYERRA